MLANGEESSLFFTKTNFKTQQVEQPPENLASQWQELQKDTYPKGRPLVRYLARFFDLSLFSLFLITSCIHLLSEICVRVITCLYFYP